MMHSHPTNLEIHVSFEPVPEVDDIFKADWKPEEYGLVYHFANFARMANSVITEPGDLQGWFGEALWRHYSYAPFNARVMENYHSLAFFYGYEAPWNIYHKDPRVLSRLELTLNYTFNMMGENGAIPEYAPADLDTPMLAPSSFGMEYMTSALEVAGDVMPEALKSRLIEQARKAAVYVLTSDESWEHAREFTNQFLGAMAGGAQLARLTDDLELRAMVDKAMPALLEVGHFISPMGFLYENNGPESFAYFFTTLNRLIPLYHETQDDRVLEVLRRHCAWMQKWMLLEPDHETVLLAGSHQTRTGSNYRLNGRGSRGLGELIGGGSGERVDDVQLSDDDERRTMKLFLSSQEYVENRHNSWHDPGNPIADAQARSIKDGYNPVSTLSRLSSYAPPAAEIAAVKMGLPCNRVETSGEWETDDRGNQYGFFRHPKYYAAFAFGTRQTTACYGPGFLWREGAGTCVLSANGTGPGWETRVGSAGTGKSSGNAIMREGRGGYEIISSYADLGITKSFVLRPEMIDVLISTRRSSGTPTEQVPLLLRDRDVLHMDYGTCPAAGTSSRVLGLVTRTLGIERDGKIILKFDIGAPTQASIKCSSDRDGFIRATFTFNLPAIYFNRTGYQVHLDG
jgi:hypothetical protein